MEQILVHQHRVRQPDYLQKEAAINKKTIGNNFSFIRVLSNSAILRTSSVCKTNLLFFFELGKDFPDNCAEIYAICKK